MTSGARPDTPARPRLSSDAPSDAPWLSVVGLQASGVEALGEPARRAIAEAAFVFGGERHLALAASLVTGTQIAWPSPFAQGIEHLLSLRGQRVCVLASGDPFHYGVGATLSAHLAPAEMQVYPAPSAFSLACARLGWPQQRCRTLSLHGRPLSNLAAHLHAGARLLLLTDDGQAPARIAALLHARGLGASRLIVLEAMGGPRERESRQSAAALAEQPVDFDALNLVALELPSDASGDAGGLAPGRADSLFEHDGQISRRDVRAMSLGRLAPRPGERLWDVGAGAGAIAIEWLRLDERLEAIAIERDEARAERIKRNADALGTPQLQVITGEAPAALDGLAAPDAIFVGGGVSDMALMARCFDALVAGGRLVANAVTLEGELALGECHRLLGGSLTRLALEQTAPLGRMTGFAPARTLTQWCWVKPDDFPGAS